MKHSNIDNDIRPGTPADPELYNAAKLYLQVEKMREMGDGFKAARDHSERNVEMEINLVELMFYLISKLHYVLIGIIVGTVLMGMYATKISVPIYSATAKLYIVGQNDNSVSSILSMAELQRGSALTMDYQEVFRTWEVHQMVNEALGTNYSYGQLQGMLSVSNPESTRILYITVRNTDPELAANLANAYIDAAKRFIMETMNTDEPNAFSIALVPTSASQISVTSYAFRGFLLGAALSIGLLVVIFLLDSRPKSTDDIMRYAGIPTLAVIPANEYLSGKGRRLRKIPEVWQ